MKLFIAFAILALSAITSTAQKQIHLDIQTTVKMASDSSLTAFINKNMFLADYWTFRSYKAERLPSLTLNLMPATYNRTLVSRYDSYADRDIYRQQKSYAAYGGLSLTQNFDPIGGQFYIQSSLDFLRYFGASTFNQFSAAPVTIGFRHSMLGYNDFKWDKRIEPLKYEKAKLEYLYNSENIASLAVNYFFTLAKAQAHYQQALEQKASCDSLLITGERKYKIAAISKSDLLSLRLDVVNARNSIKKAEVEMKRATLNLTSFLGIDSNTDISIQLPGVPTKLNIDTNLSIEMMHKNSYMILEKLQNISEAERNLDKIKKTTRFNANIDANVGFNQQADNAKDAYSNIMRRDVVSIGLSIPLLDWGVGKGKRNTAQNTLNVARIEAEQKIMELEQNIIITISELQTRIDLMKSAEEALILANLVYNDNKMKFQTGNCDITMLYNSQQRLLTAQNDYIECMHNYWSCYYDLRRQTLYDFVLEMPLSDIFDFNNILSER